MKSSCPSWKPPFLILLAALAVPAFALAQDSGAAGEEADARQESQAAATTETDATAADSPAANPAAAAQAAEAPATPEATGTAPSAAAGDSATPDPAPGEPTAAARPQPRLVIGEMTRELGPVQRGQRVEIIFELANEGDAPLRIRNVEPSCGCTVASFDREIAPGATGKVTAKLDTSVLQGAVLKSLTVLSNDPLLPKVQLLIRAEIVSFVTAAPTYARLLQVQGAESARTAVNLWASDGTALEIGPITTGFDWIEASARRAEPAEINSAGPAEQWRVEISTHSDAPLGPLTETIVIPTSHPGQPKVEIPLSGFVRPVLATTPSRVDFGTVAERADQRRFLLKLFNFGKEPVAVSATTTDLSFVDVTLEPDEPGRRFKLRLQLAEDAPKGKFEGTLRIESDSTLMPVVEIPVRGRLR